MEDEDYRIINFANTTIKCFRDGRIFTISKKCKKYEKWNERPSNPNNLGYINISIGGKLHKAHRLIMLAFVGESDQAVDHINRIKTDNRFENLRYVTRTENNLNRDWIDNAKGYYWHRNKWRARIHINNKSKNLGGFDNEQDARQAYLDAKDKQENEP
jgi:vacuolar-type H+-ATPase subunit I/STV1